jgi:hypothetical protein
MKRIEPVTLLMLSIMLGSIAATFKFAVVELETSRKLESLKREYAATTQELDDARKAVDDLVRATDAEDYRHAIEIGELTARAERCDATPIPCTVPGKALCYDDADLVKKVIDVGVSYALLDATLSKR